MHVFSVVHFFLFYFIIIIVVVDVIKPKPMPRQRLSPTSINISPNETTSASTISSTTITSSAITTSSVKSKTEAIVQRFSYSAGDGHSPPEVLKRFAGKQIATIFEV